MNDNTTQDDLLAKINGLTSGMSLPEEPQPAPSEGPVLPVMPDMPLPPQPQVEVQASPMPSVQTPVMPEMPSMPQAPMSTPSDTVAPEMPSMPQAADPFAASLGAMPVNDNNQAPNTDVPSMTSRIPVPDNKIPTFDKPAKKKSNGGFAFLVVVLIILILGAGGFALYSNGMLDGIIDKFFGKEEVLDIPVVDEPVIDEPVVEEPEVKFVDNTKTAGISDKVVEANYTMEGLDYDASYIKVPYLNLTTDDAKKINSEIQEMYKSYADTSAAYKKENNDNLINNPDNFKQKYLLVYYQAITQGDVVSLLINELNYEGAGDAIWNHKTYTVSASTGKQLGLKDLETILSVDDNAMNTAYEAYITQIISQSTASEAKKTFEHKINAFKTLQDYYSNLNSNSGIEYYVDGMGRINIITKVYIGDKNIYKIVAYAPTGCAVKSFTINDAKTFVGYKAMTPSVNNNNDNNKEAVVTTASSTLQVSAKSLSKYVDGDLIDGDNLIKLYQTYENMLGQKGDSITFQVSNNVGSKSYSKGDLEILKNDIKKNAIYELSIINYANGGYRIIKAKLYRE